MRKKLLEGSSTNQCSDSPEKAKPHAAQLVLSGSTTGKLATNGAINGCHII
jgi:hypothetical protein